MEVLKIMVGRIKKISVAGARLIELKWEVIMAGRINKRSVDVEQ